MRPHGKRFLVIAILIVILATCTYPYAVWVQPDSTVTRLTFGLATKRHGRSVKALEYFYVDPCQTRGDRDLEERLWMIGIPDYGGEGTRVRELAYGQVPTGYEERVPPRPLIPGCYRVYASAAEGRSGGTAFWARQDGSISELTRAERDSAAAVNRRRSVEADSIALLRCYEGYRAALTAEDTAVVDQQLWYDTTYFPPDLTCQEICTEVGPRSEGEATRRSQCSTPRPFHLR